MYFYAEDYDLLQEAVDWCGGGKEGIAKVGKALDDLFEDGEASEHEDMDSLYAMLDEAQGWCGVVETMDALGALVGKKMEHGELPAGNACNFTMVPIVDDKDKLELIKRYEEDIACEEASAEELHQEETFMMLVLKAAVHLMKTNRARTAEEVGEWVANTESWSRRFPKGGKR